MSKSSGGGADFGVDLTSGRFTDEAQAVAAGRNLKLLDGAALLQLIRSGGSAANQAAPVPVLPRALPEASAAQTPACPICSKTMVRRVAQKGARAGSAFWGCVSYPGCRGTRPL